MTIAVDWDNTIWDRAKQVPMPGAREALSLLRENGHYIMVHSCNNPPFIRKRLEEHDIMVDAVWGESPADKGHKPVADFYIDDAALHFQDWGQALNELNNRRPWAR